MYYDIYLTWQELLRLRDSLDVFQDDNNRARKRARKFDFERVKREIDGSSNKDKIAYLIQKKTEYLQETDSNWESGVKFDRKCDLEIEKIDKTYKATLYYYVEEGEEVRAERGNETSEDISLVRNRNLTLEQTVLFFYYLFIFAKLNCSNVQKAKVIAALTGFSENTLQQQFSTIHKKAVENPKAYLRDIEVVKENFNHLNFSKIITIIERDLKI